MSRRNTILIAVGVALIVLLILVGAIASITSKHKNSAADKIGIIRIEGVIAGGQSQGKLMREGIGADTVIKQLREAKDDPTIKAVVIRINSPGGSAAASQEIGYEIKKIKATGKMVVTSMGDTAASGGYWIAANTDKIYADPTTITGSIGVYMSYMNYEELMKKVGVTQGKIKSGAHKDIMSPERQMTAEEREIIQGMVDDIYDQFIDVVAEGRKLDQAKVKALADGRVYTGRQAEALGLIDEYGNLYDAIDATAQMVGIQGKPEIKEFSGSNLWDTLFGAQDKAAISELLFKQFLKSQLPSSSNFMMPMPIYQQEIVK